MLAWRQIDGAPSADRHPEGRAALHHEIARRQADILREPRIERLVPRKPPPRRSVLAPRGETRTPMAKHDLRSYDARRARISNSKVQVAPLSFDASPSQRNESPVISTKRQRRTTPFCSSLICTMSGPTARPIWS